MRWSGCRAELFSSHAVFRYVKLLATIAMLTGNDTADLICTAGESRIVLNPEDQLESESREPDGH